MVRHKRHLERCFKLASATTPNQARQMFDHAIQHVRNCRPQFCDAIISEFEWADYVG